MNKLLNPKVRWYPIFVLHNYLCYLFEINHIHLFLVSCNKINLSYTANVNSQITDKLRHLSVISKQIHLFLVIFESCYNHRQMFVKIKIKFHIQQKKLRKFCQYEKSLLKQQKKICRFDRICLFFSRFGVMLPTLQCWERQS